jgi:hydroxymethylpyrimidine pyrophosphatase-like HAD family hydrolase
LNWGGRRRYTEEAESESGTGRTEENMKEILLACDLDNTLIHSWKHRKEGDLCIEHIGEKEQGYMSRKAAELYSSLPENILLVPVTTRSVDQYRRIRWPGSREPDLAVTTNGAILLGPRDEAILSCLRMEYKENDMGGLVQRNQGSDFSVILHDWIGQSQREAAPFRQAMDELREILLTSGHYLRVRMVDDFYLFAYCEEGKDPKEAVPESAFRSGLQIVSSGRKIYFLPPAFNKGEAVRRLEGLLQPPRILAAGDTEIDLPMAERADRMFIPEKLYRSCGSDLPQTVRRKLTVCPEGADFSEFVLREAVREAEQV